MIPQVASGRARVRELLGVELPLIQAPVGSATSVELTAAVSEAGALGTLAVSWRGERQMRQMLGRLRASTDRPWAVNLVLEWDQHVRLEACLEEGARIVSFFWGDPQPYIADVHAAGGVVLHTVGDVEEARRAVDAGADAIIAQGWEAGGHVRGKVATMALVPAVVDAVGDAVPVLAAGGIADGRGVAAALALGAGGAMLGTRFLLTHESDTHTVYRAALSQATVTDTAYSTLFDGGWPDAPHRTLRNSTVSVWEQAGCPPSGDRPGEGEAIAQRRNREIVRYSDDMPTADTEGDVEQLAMYAGQSAGLVASVDHAGLLVRRIAAEADAILAGLAGEGRADSGQLGRNDVHHE
jgi:NAD(P)H-dependent flavin oxidoreductase YrpB (nitropropane dioxygenase family)